jgi:hypothetical protein
VLAKQTLYLLSQTSLWFIFGIILEMGSPKLFAQAGLKPGSPDLSLPSSLDLWVTVVCH